MNELEGAVSVNKIPGEGGVWKSTGQGQVVSEMNEREGAVLEEHESV